MKRLVVTMLVLLIAASLFAAPRPRPAKTLKLATLAPRGTSFDVALQAMGQQWKAAPGGVKLTIYTDGTMGSESDVVRRMRLGQLQAALLTVAGLAEVDPAATALQEMPMMFNDLAEVDYVGRHLQPLLAEKMRRKGFVVLFWADAGWVQFFSRKAATTPADFRNQRIFVTVNSNEQTDLMKRLGYDPVPLEFADALTSLKTGMIDAIPTAPFHALAGQYYTVANHMAEVNWVPLVGALVVNARDWDALEPATREAFAKAAAEAGARIRERGRLESQQALTAMKKRGLVVHSLSAKERSAWVQMARGVYPHLRGGRVPADIFDEVQRLLATLRTPAAAPAR